MPTSALRANLRSAVHRLLWPWGIDIRKLRKDRVVLERVIFPYLKSREDFRRILFVGCAWYTQHYPSLFADREFITLEIDPGESRFGGPRHIIDSCENLPAHFQPNTLDVVVFTGVYGFGLNQMPAIRKSLLGIHQSLRPGGLFIFGWNDRPATAPYRFEELQGLEQFQPEVFPPLGTDRYELNIKNGHIFNFFTKAEVR